MGQRRSLRPVRPRSRPGPLGTGPYVVFQHQSGRYPYYSVSKLSQKPQEARSRGASRLGREEGPQNYLGPEPEFVS